MVPAIPSPFVIPVRPQAETGTHSHRRLREGTVIKPLQRYGLWVPVLPLARQTGMTDREGIALIESMGRRA
jgi:hypothetical protein